MQRGANALDRYARQFGEIRSGDLNAEAFESFGERSRIEAPRIGIVGAASVAVGNDVYVRSQLCIEAYAHPGDVVLRFHDEIQVGYNVRFVAFNGIEVCDLVGIGHGCTVSDSPHQWKTAGDDEAMWDAPPAIGRTLRIERRVWVGNNTMIVGGVTIGESAIIGPNSVISRDVPAFTIVGGNPARVERRRLPSGEWETLADPIPLHEYSSTLPSTSPSPRIAPLPQRSGREETV